MTEETLPRQLVSDFHQCWFPIALSSEIDAGQLVGKDFLDGKVVVYRGSGGRASTVSAYCRHLGAYLGLGEVVGDNVKCAFHEWEYGPDGRCNHIPVTDRIPEEARLFSFPTTEAWGLVWVFNGEEPTYDVPSFPMVEAEALSTSVFEIDPKPVPPWVLISNVIDFQHLASMHGAAVAKPPEEIDVGDHTVEFHNHVEDPRIGDLNLHVKLFGTNTITLEFKASLAHFFSLFTAAPVGRDGCKGYTVTGVLPGDDTQQRLEMAEAFGKSIMAEDNPVMETIRFRPDVLIPADRALGRYLRYVRQHPQGNPAADLIR